MKNPFLGKRSYYSLSVLDLLEARDLYHVHLAHLENVVATALGRFRYRSTDPGNKDPSAELHDDSAAPAAGKSPQPPRELHTSEVKRWSPPCILVFVKHWFTPDEMREHPDDLVPRYLYLPDGRVVPTCVILVREQERVPALTDHLSFSSGLMGGGYSVLTDVQRKTHVGSVACLVSDGDTTYALTNRHVTGSDGREISTVIDGERVRVGVSAGKQVGKLPFGDAYTGWPGARAYSNLDAGLIRIDDINQWTTQVFGVGQLDTPVDLNIDTISLDLIGCPVRAFGAASGELEGEIAALFYRYHSIGGFDYVSDLLIGPRSGESGLRTRPGDSGTLWFFDPQERDQCQRGGKERVAGPARLFRPLALQWGGHVVVDAGADREFHYALATCLSTICRLLDVGVVRDWNIGHPEYWGEMGHFTVGAKACNVLPDAILRKFMQANLDRIGYDDAVLKTGKFRPEKGPHAFVPLADVADDVWRVDRGHPERKPFARRDDENNHFADMDQPGPKGTKFAGKTLLDLCKNPANVDPQVWLDFYESFRGSGTHMPNKGALPFRVWQLYEEAVEAVRAKDVARYLCASGIMAHYVGDACQPLHVSFMHHGKPGGTDEEKKIHEAYESQMLDRKRAVVVQGVNEALNGKHATSRIRGGKAAARAVVELMRQTVKLIPPADIVKAFPAGASGPDQTDALWKRFGARTAQTIANGALCLATLWASAWEEGGGKNIDHSELGPIPVKDLQKLYEDPRVFPSCKLEDMIPLLKPTAAKPARKKALAKTTAAGSSKR